MKAVLIFSMLFSVSLIGSVYAQIQDNTPYSFSTNLPTTDQKNSILLSGKILQKQNQKLMDIVDHCMASETTRYDLCVEFFKKTVISNFNLFNETRNIIDTILYN